MRSMRGLVSAAVVAAVATSSAGDAQMRVYRDQVGEWEISTFSAGRCSAGREYPTGTHVFVSSSSDGRAGLSVLNRAWPVRNANSYGLRLIQGGASRSFAAEDDRSFQGLSRSAANGAPLLAQLGEGGSMEVTGSDGIVLERVDLGGIAQALARLGPCVAEIATAANFPAPPAPPAPPRPPSRRGGKAQPARARVSLPELFSAEDYPVSAVRAGAQGAVGFRLDVGPDGRVAVCTVTTSSGSPILDTTTCRLLRARARFLPALDRKGRPTMDSHSGRIVWLLPEPEPEPEPELPPPPPPGQ